MYHMMDKYKSIFFFFFILNTNHYSVLYQFDKINTRNFFLTELHIVIQTLFRVSFFFLKFFEFMLNNLHYFRNLLKIV